ncbi:MAG: hypothetical protein U0V48_11290 [Anaerolineales bacterium]
MDKKKKININLKLNRKRLFLSVQTRVSDINLLTKDDTLIFLDRVILTDKMEEKSTKGKKKESG